MKEGGRNEQEAIKIKSPELVKTRQAEICRAAEELFAQKGYHKTTIRDIAKKSGISVGSLYDYIKNKEDILFLLGREFFRHLRTEVVKVLEEKNDVTKELEGVLETMVRVVDRFQEYVLFTYREGKSLKREHLVSLLEQDAFFTQTLAEIIKKGIEEGVFRTQEPEIVANLVTIMTHAWALKRYNLRKFSFYSFQKVLVQIVLDGLMSGENLNEKR